MTLPGSTGGSQPQHPTVLSGRYELGEELDSGGMSTVYLAHDLELDRTVAIKLLPQDPEPDQVERLRREARAAAAIEHPNVAGVHDIGVSDESVFVVIEYLRGQSLRDVLARDGCLSTGYATHIAAEVCLALSAAHQAGVIHRDITPGNIMLCADGTVKVLDFGIARLDGNSFRTATGQICGTPAFVSPEQARDEPLDGRSDVYSLGCCLYQMVTGHAPFEASTPLAVVTAHLHEPPRPPREIDPTIADPVQQVVLRALAKRPHDRYPTAEAMHAELTERTPARTLALPTMSAGTTDPAESAGDRTAVGPELGDPPDEGSGAFRRWLGITLIAAATAVLIVVAIIALTQTPR